MNSSPWLERHDWWIGGSVLALAGAFQFTSLKDACLDKCRHPGQFIMRYYERGVGGGLRLGMRHGAFCVGCCWALMLVMFAAGVASLLWMALLTAVMIHEKTRPAGARPYRSPAWRCWRRHRWCWRTRQPPRRPPDPSASVGTYVRWHIRRTFARRLGS